MDPTRNFTPQKQRLYNPTPAATNMPSAQPRPRSRGIGHVRNQESGSSGSKVFNCIVDDTALVQGAKKSTRDGIQKWIAGGQIRLFVPLYTLNQTSRVKDAKSRIATDAEEALLWLDDATSSAPHLVTLQGGFEKFETWAEVDKFALPQTLFSESDGQEEAVVDDLVQQTDASLTVGEAREQRPSLSSNDSFHSRSTQPSYQSVRSVSPLSPPTSPPKHAVEASSPVSRMDDQKSSDPDAAHSMSNSSGGRTAAIPVALRPLFNYILWRIHQEIDPVAALETFIFLCDDPAKRKYAQRFGIRTKSLADIRYAIAREGQETRNRQLVQKKEAAQNPTPPPTASNQPLAPKLQESTPAVKVSDSVSVNGDNASDDDEIVLKRPPKAPAAMLAVQSPRSGRSGKVLDPNQFTRNISGASRGSVTRGGSLRGGLSRGSSRVVNAGRGAARSDNSGPIDPDSFSRPPPGRGGLRGGRKLFIPT